MKLDHTHLKRGAAFIKPELGLSILITIVGGLVFYFTSVNAQNNALADAKTEASKELSVDRQRISTLEEAVKTIKDGNTEMRNDIKELLRRTPK